MASIEDIERILDEKLKPIEDIERILDEKLKPIQENVANLLSQVSKLPKRKPEIDETKELHHPQPGEFKDTENAISKEAPSMDNKDTGNASNGDDKVLERCKIILGQPEDMLPNAEDYSEVGINGKRLSGRRISMVSKVLAESSRKLTFNQFQEALLEVDEKINKNSPPKIVLTCDGKVCEVEVKRDEDGDVEFYPGDWSSVSFLAHHLVEPGSLRVKRRRPINMLICRESLPEHVSRRAAAQLITECEAVILGHGRFTFELETDLVEAMLDVMTTAATRIQEFRLLSEVKLKVSGTALGKLLPLFKVVLLDEKDMVEEDWAAWATGLDTRVKEEGRDAAQSVVLWSVNLTKVSDQTLATLFSSMKRIELRGTTEVSPGGWQSCIKAIADKYNSGEGVLQEFDTSSLRQKGEYKEYINKINQHLVEGNT